MGFSHAGAHRPCPAECKDTLDTLSFLEPPLWQGDTRKQELFPSEMSPHIPLGDFQRQRASLHNPRMPDVPVHLPTETFLVKRELVLYFLDYFPSPNSHQFHAWASNSLLQFIQVVAGNIIAMDVFLRYLEAHPFSVHSQYSYSETLRHPVPRSRTCRGTTFPWLASWEWQWFS